MLAGQRRLLAQDASRFTIKTVQARLAHVLSLGADWHQIAKIAAPRLRVPRLSPTLAKNKHQQEKKTTHQNSP
jgi:hypothetical protein